MFLAITTIASGKDLPKQGDQENTGSTYAFVGADLLAEYKTDFYPVLSADRKGLVIDSSVGDKHVDTDARYSVQLRVKFSNNLTKVEDFKFYFDSEKETRRMMDILADQAMLGDQFEIEASSLRQEIAEYVKKIPALEFYDSGRDNSDIVNKMWDQLAGMQSQLDEVESAAEEYNDLYYQIIADQQIKDRISDTIYLSMRLNPRFNVENAYCALMITRGGGGSYPGSQNQAVSTVHVRKIGNLRAGVNQKVTLSWPVIEGSYADAACEIFLYSGNGESIALTNSRALKELTWEQYLRVKEIEEKLLDAES